MSINISGKLGFDHWPLQTRQNILALAQRQTKTLKPIGAFVEVENGVVGDKLAIVVKSAKLNHEAHKVPQYLMNRYALAKQKQTHHSTLKKARLQNLPRFGMLSLGRPHQNFLDFIHDPFGEWAVIESGGIFFGLLCISGARYRKWVLSQIYRAVRPLDKFATKPQKACINGTSEPILTENMNRSLAIKGDY